MSRRRSGWRRALAALALAGSAALPFVAPAAADAPWERFVGSYAGEAVADTRGALHKRDLEVDVVELDRGFRVAWKAVTRKPDGRSKPKGYSVDFLPSRRDGVFESAMRKDMFGNRVPLDPIRGDPYVWARIEGETLSVFSLLITGSGSYDMQVYHRTLVADGLSVRYTRFSEGEVVRTVQGSLRRR